MSCYFDLRYIMPAYTVRNPYNTSPLNQINSGVDYPVHWDVFVAIDLVVKADAEPHEPGLPLPIPPVLPGQPALP